MKKRLRYLLAIVAVVITVPTAWGQNGGDNPPEILTSELALKTILETDRLEVNFVIVDTDKVTEVTINGDKQPIEAADTVMLSRTFVFSQDVTRLRVTAKDEAGHERTVVYTVFRPGVDPDKKIAQEAPKGRLFAAYDARYESDSNPTNDLSSPIVIEGVKLSGVVPDDQQTDTRLNVNASVGYAKGDLTGYGGISRIQYSKDDNKAYNVMVLFLGGVWAIPRGETAAIELGYTFADINVGDGDYAQSHTFSPGYRSASVHSDGDTATSLYGADLVLKTFAVSQQESATAYRLKADYNSQDKAKQDSYRRRFYYGTESEGLPETEYSFLGGDWDWKNRWDSGVLFDIGLGVQYRNYVSDLPLSVDTPLGAKRVDVPMRLSSGVGYQLKPNLRLMGNYQYLFNLSNKSPYVRQIMGVGVSGTF